MKLKNFAPSPGGGRLLKQATSAFIARGWVVDLSDSIIRRSTWHVKYQLQSLAAPPHPEFPHSAGPG